MDPVENPYTPGAGTPPPVLTGREQEFRQVDRLLRRLAAGRHDRSIMISGLRGVGKTVLLGEVALRATEAGWVTSDVIEIRADAHARHLLGKTTLEVLRQLSSSGRLARQSLHAALRKLGAFSAALTEKGVELTLDLEPRHGADSGIIEDDLPDLWEEIGQLALDAGTGALFLFDEMHLLERPGLEAISAALHRISQRRLPLAVMGAGLPHLASSLADAKTYAERLYAFVHLDRLDEPAALEALVQPARSLGIEFEPTAADYIVSRAECYPYFLQEYASEAWNIADSSPIGLPAARQAHDAARRALDRGFFRARFEKAGPAERRYMQAMASLGRGPYPVRDVAEALGGSRQRRATSQLDGLAHKGLVFVPHPEWVAFSVPQFDDYLRRNHPL